MSLSSTAIGYSPSSLSNAVITSPKIKSSCFQELRSVDECDSNSSLLNSISSVNSSSVLQESNNNFQMSNLFPPSQNN
jgi:hypothetical protein